MPLFEYVCNGCKSTTEVLQSSSDAPLTTCERCGGELRKLLSAPSFQFKGTGWYVSDYGKPGSSDREGGEKEKGDAQAPSEGTKPSEGTRPPEATKPAEGSKAGETASPAGGSGTSGGEKPDR